MHIGILGGTFDPIHEGHLALARRFAELLQLTELILLPAGQPWQKSNISSARHRLMMTRLAAKELNFSNTFANTSVSVATDEIERSGPTFTLDTLMAWRKRIGPQASLTLLMGNDQLCRLNTWHNWRSLFDYAHLGVGLRPGFTLASAPPEIADEIAIRASTNAQLHAQPQGLILLDTMLTPDISSTHIRQITAHTPVHNPTHNQTVYNVPQAVWRYIRRYRLYQS